MFAGADRGRDAEPRARGQGTRRTAFRAVAFARKGSQDARLSAAPTPGWELVSPRRAAAHDRAGVHTLGAISAALGLVPAACFFPPVIGGLGFAKYGLGRPSALRGEDGKDY